jgi:hypothetical protein
MAKKLFERPKNGEKSTLSRTLKKPTKWSPARAARNRGAEGSQGAFMTRSREEGLPASFKQETKKNPRTWEWHVECERSDVRGVL